MNRREPTIWVIYGTRPEVVKLTPVIKALESRPESIKVRRIFTGQHGKLARDLFPAMDMTPDQDLNLMRPEQTPAELGARCLTTLSSMLDTSPPDLVVVQGDTATVLFASLAGFLSRVPVGHVEAGLRTGDRYSPFPEEMMRRQVGQIASLHFAPSKAAARNLGREGVDPELVRITGNTSVDAIRWAASVSAKRVDQSVRQWVQDHPRFVVVTIHRRESWGEASERIIAGLTAFANEREVVDFFWPVHPNPKVASQVREATPYSPNIHLMEPVGYFEMSYLLKNCMAVLTDSGGLQEEATALGKPVVVAREETERPEGIEAGWLRLSGTDPQTIQDSLRTVVEGASVDSIPIKSPYGDGRAGARIADIVTHFLTGRPRETTDWIDMSELDD